MSSGLELQSLQVGSTSDLLNLALLVCRGYEPVSSFAFTLALVTSFTSQLVVVHTACGCRNEVFEISRFCRDDF